MIEEKEYLSIPEDKYKSKFDSKDWQNDNPSSPSIDKGEKSKQFTTGNTDDSRISDITITTDGIVSSNWINVGNLSGKILSISDDNVIVDCLIDSFPKRYQKRSIKKSLFKGIPLELGRLIMIRVFENPPESKFILEDGNGRVPETDFSTQHLFKNIEANKMFTLK